VGQACEGGGTLDGIPEEDGDGNAGRDGGDNAAGSDGDDDDDDDVGGEAAAEKEVAAMLAQLQSSQAVTVDPKNSQDDDPRRKPKVRPILAFCFRSAPQWANLQWSAAFPQS
jgi:hypothetical protein